MTIDSLSLLSTILAPSTPKVPLSLSLSLSLSLCLVTEKTKVEKRKFKVWIWKSCFSLKKFCRTGGDDSILWKDTCSTESSMAGSYIWLVSQATKWVPLYFYYLAQKMKSFYFYFLDFLAECVRSNAVLFCSISIVLNLPASFISMGTGTEIFNIAIPWFWLGSIRRIRSSRD